MGTIECSQPASISSWDSQDFGDISMVLKMAYFRKSTGPRWVKVHIEKTIQEYAFKTVINTGWWYAKKQIWSYRLPT